MYNDENFELTRDEIAALSALPREMQPSDILETRVLRALRDQGHFGSVSRGERRTLALAWKIAATITLFAGGVATGRYALAASAPASASASASTTAPVTDTRDAQKSVPRNDIRTVQQKETVVAIREMWL
jgi:hypothetical protein